MDYTFSDDERAFRDELIGLIERETGGAQHESYETGDDQTETERRFLETLGERGWLTPGWPKRYGGGELPLMKQLILNQELAYRGAPRVIGVGPNIAGQAILVFGSEEQKDRLLPPISRNEANWCQGFSEPGAGSDLASLQCRAVRDGDTYVVNGTKMWTSYSHLADWIILLVRTDPEAPKHKGITCLLVERRSPGITLNPYLTMQGHHHFNEVVFDDVRVPASMRLGEENRGWYVAATALDFERSGIGVIAGNRRSFEDMLQQLKLDQDRLSPALRRTYRNQIADLYIQLAVGTQMSYRVGWMQSRGLIPNYEASMSKVFASELGRNLYNAAIGMQGLYGPLRPGSPYARADGRLIEHFQYNVILNIAAGSSEIQRNIIATRGLGLPR